jgi:hypothetical protein
MMDFDQELKKALKRREPPRDLTGSVMARIETVPKARWRWIPAAGIAALLVVGVGGYQWEQYQKGQQAKRQVMLAMRVTAQKLAVAESKVSELNHRRIAYE